MPCATPIDLYVPMQCIVERLFMRLHIFYASDPFETTSEAGARCGLCIALSVICSFEAELHATECARFKLRL